MFNMLGQRGGGIEINVLKNGDKSVALALNQAKVVPPVPQPVATNDGYPRSFS